MRKSSIKRSESYKNKIFIYLLSAVLVPVIILGAYCYNTYKSEVTNKLDVSTQATANQVKARVDSVLFNIRKSYSEAIDCDEVDWILDRHINYSDYSNIVSAIDVLDGTTYLSEYISGFSFVNFKTGWVISNRGMYSFNELNNKEDIRELYQYNENTLIRNFWINKLSTANTKKLPRETVNINALSYVMKLPVNISEPYALLIVNINQDRLERLFSDDLGSNDITIFDKEKNLVYTTNENIYEYCKLNDWELKKESINRVRLNDGKKYNMAVRESDVIDWTYVVSYDMNTILKGALNILSFSLVMGAVVVIVLIVAIIWTRRIYKPVSNLTNHIRKLSSDEFAVSSTSAENNDLEYIANSIDKLVDNNVYMENLIVNQQSQLRELFILRLIRGEIKAEHFDYYMNRLDIKLMDQKAVVSINIRSQEGFEVYDETKQDAIRIEVVEKLPLKIKELLSAPAICNARAIIMFITEGGTNELEEKILSFYEELTEFVKMSYGLQISMGVSTVFTELTQFREAYNTSMEALKNSEMFSREENVSKNSEIMFYSDISTNIKNYIYDLTLEKDIKEAVDSCEQEKSFEAIDRFVDEIIKSKLSSSECYFHMQRFMLAIVLVATNAGLSVNEIFKTEMTNIFLSFNQIYDMEKIRSFYKYKLALPIITELNQFRASRSSDIMQKIQELIEDTKGDITLAECAQKLNYHPSYIWKIMKFQKNTTFTDYIAVYKIEEAKKLLISTDLTVAHIAASLNYTNTQNFIRFFSKHVGTTPGKYRQNYNSVVV